MLKFTAGIPGIPGSSRVSRVFKIFRRLSALGPPFRLFPALWLAVDLVLLPAAGAQETSPPLKVCATVPDLGDLAREIGGDAVAVTVFTKGPQDPHFLEGRPSFIKELSKADLFLLVGLDLEVGWAPNLWQNARNGAVLPGAPGFLEASQFITPLDLPAGIVDRTLGDVHVRGNPHFLLDPVNGLKVARGLRDRLGRLRPERSDHFAARYEDFARRLNVALAGEKLAGRYDGEKLAVLAAHGKLEEFLQKQGAADLLGGWLGRLAPFRGAQLVADHNLWPYFAERFGLKVVGFLEPKPGIAPTTKHLGALVETMKGLGVRGILSVPYFNVRHAEFVAGATGARVIPVAHQCGSQPGTDGYIAMVNHNVDAIAAALGGKK